MTKTERIEYTAELKVPVVSISAARASSSKIKLTAAFEDYENADDYFEVKRHGIIYITSSRLGNKNLTLNTAGRTNITFTKFSAEGQFSYTMKPSTKSTTYVVRGYVQYVDENGIYHFPKEFLTEKDSCWILGCHMGLGESRRKKNALELEGTFRAIMLINRIMKNGGYSK